MVFWIGRLTKAAPAAKPVVVAHAETQKDEAIVPSRLRELLKAEQDRSAQFRAAATEAQKGMELGMEERNQLYQLLGDGARLLRKMMNKIDDHMEVCPHRVPVMASRHGECWHFDSCHCAEAVVDRNRMRLRHCAHCADFDGPLDRLNFEMGGCLRDELQAWLADHAGLWADAHASLSLCGKAPPV